MVIGVVVYADTGMYEEVKINGLEDMQKAVQGRIEIFPHLKGCDAQVTAYVNEEGNLLGLNINPVATTLMTTCFGFNFGPYMIRGNVLLLGNDDKSLSKKQRKQIENFFPRTN